MNRSLLLQFALKARRFLWWLTRPVTVGVRVIATDSAGRVLLVRHTYGDACWYLPGGGVQRNETAGAAARRELTEEAGIVPDGSMSIVGVFSSFVEFKSDHIIVFAASCGTQQPKATALEIGTAQFFPAHDLPERLSPATRRRLLEYLRGEPASESW